MRYTVLKDFKGSPDGRFAVDYTAGGEPVELTESLAIVAIAAGWVEPAGQDAPPPGAEHSPTLFDRAAGAIRKLKKAKPA